MESMTCWARLGDVEDLAQVGEILVGVIDAETDCLVACDVGARLGEGQGLDAVLGQVVGGEGGADLEAVVPAGEEEVGVEADQLLQGEVVGGDLADLS